MNGLPAVLPPDAVDLHQGAVGRGGEQGGRYSPCLLYAVGMRLVMDVGVLALVDPDANDPEYAREGDGVEAI